MEAEAQMLQHEQVGESTSPVKKTEVVVESEEDFHLEKEKRLQNQKLAGKLADEECIRRIQEMKDRESEMEIVRQINIEYSMTAADEEKQRRIREYEIAKVQDQVIRERRKSDAIEAAEQERQRRISEVGDVATSDLKERAQQQAKAIKEMEKERSRRLSSPEHSRRLCNPNLAVNDDFIEPDVIGEGALSEIPVVQSSLSKILVDENTEWRCYISSDNPQEEKDKLCALRQSLEQELKACQQFPELTGDVRLLRFLRGNKMNVSLAATKFREMLELRKTLNLDEIRQKIKEKSLPIEEFPHFDKIIQFIPFLNVYDLTDQEGNVFYFEKTGYADIKGLFEKVTDEEWQEYYLYDMEFRSMKLDALSRNAEKLVRCNFVRDLDGFAISRFNPRILKRFQNSITIATKCYPETVHETLILNISWIFHKIWSTFIPWFQETQLKKIVMEATSYEHLLTLIARDKLPKLLGGRSISHVIPQTGFLGRDSFLMVCEEGGSRAEIRAGGILQLPFRMNANDTICWEYEVKSHDIDFSVKFRTQGDGGAEEEDKVKKSRVSHGKTIANSYTATEDGTVVLSWDNSYSWTRAKTIAYKAKVVKATHDFSSLDISGNDCV